MTCRISRNMPSDYMKWRDHIQLKHDVMPPLFWIDPFKMYEDDYEWHLNKEKTDETDD